MINLTDEILNKYIDGELEPFELTEIKNEIEKNEEALSRLKALQLTDSLLRQMEVEKTPEYFTDKLMKVILSASKVVKPRLNYFFVTIISLFSLGVIGVIALAINSSNNESSPSTTAHYIDKVKDVIGKNLSEFQKFFSDKNVLLAVSILTLILLVTLYLTFEAHKNFKNKLNSYSR